MAIFNMVGGGRASQPFAMVLVNYPQNSTLTATNCDGYQDISPSSASAPQRLYYVSAPSSGTTQSCTFTITDGTQTKSQTVSLTIGTAQTITMSYAVYLFNNGLVSGITFDSAVIGTDRSTSTTIGVGLKIDSTGRYVTDAIDLTPYTTLHAKVSGQNSNSYTQSTVWVSSTKTQGTQSGASPFPSTQLTYSRLTAQSCEIDIDVSAINTACYIGFGGWFGLSDDYLDIEVLYLQ